MFVITNDFLAVEYNTETRIISVSDRRCSKRWEQYPFHLPPITEKIERSENALSFSFRGDFPFRLKIELVDAELIYSISAETDCHMDCLHFPPAFKTPDPQHYMVMTDSEGLLLPADDQEYPLSRQPIYNCAGGPGMAWLGVTDGSFNTGYMAIYETPFDAEIDVLKKDGLITFETVWLSSKKQFSYDRRIRYVFFSEGGYVAQCKCYRTYAWAKNDVITLQDRAAHLPAIKKMMGAVQIFVWDNARTDDFINELKESGIEKALVFWDPNHQPYPSAGFDEALLAAGYGSGMYELFTDILEETPENLSRLMKAPLAKNVYPGLFKELTAKREDGSTYSNQFGTYICPAAIRTEMLKRIEMERQFYQNETYFLDVYQANGLYECYDDTHPLTRTGYAKAIVDHYRTLENHFDVYLGGEFGADFAAGHSCYVQGMMTLQRTFFNTEIDDAESIYYMGDWKDHERPAAMLGSRTAAPAYLRYSVNEKIRVPLYELVYHDAVVTTWRWEDGNHHCPEIWWKKDLFNILYGTAPLWSLDYDRWNTFKKTFINSYQNINSHLGQVCYDEMLDHQFLSNDRKVQKTCFSSGKTIIANFSDEEYHYYGNIIKPQDSIII